MHRTDEPAKSDIVVQGLQAGPRLRTRRYIDKRQQNSGHNLQYEHRKRGAAKNVPPAGSLSRDQMFRRFANRRSQLQASLEPFSNSGDHDAHGGFSPVSSAIAAPGVGNSPA